MSIAVDDLWKRLLPDDQEFGRFICLRVCDSESDDLTTHLPNKSDRHRTNSGVPLVEIPGRINNIKKDVSISSGHTPAGDSETTVKVVEPLTFVTWNHSKEGVIVIVDEHPPGVVWIINFQVSVVSVRVSDEDVEQQDSSALVRPRIPTF